MRISFITQTGQEQHKAFTDAVNQAIKVLEDRGERVVDVKFSTSGNGMMYGFQYSAMIIHNTIPQ